MLCIHLAGYGGKVSTSRLAMSVFHVAVDFRAPLPTEEDRRTTTPEPTVQGRTLRSGRVHGLNDVPGESSADHPERQGPTQRSRPSGRGRQPAAAASGVTESRETSRERHSRIRKGKQPARRQTPSATSGDDGMETGR